MVGEKGMTLLEVMLSCLLFLLIAGGSCSFSLVLGRLQYVALGEMNIKQNLSLAGKQIIEDLKKAEGLIKITGEGKQLRFSFVDVYLQHNIHYYVQQGKKQLIRDDNGSSAPLTEGVEVEIIFRKNSSRLLHVQITGQTAEKEKIAYNQQIFLANGWLE